MVQGVSDVRVGVSLDDMRALQIFKTKPVCIVAGMAIAQSVSELYET
jgi:hypothetical protein